MTDYRDSHVGGDQVDWYEHGVYAEGTYDSWLWSLERSYLAELLERRFSGRPIRFLDFACGTGRILSFLENRVAEATGLDVSDRMLEVARQKVRRATLRRGDVTREPSAIGGPYDLITAFRFFLNAQPSLREEALDHLSGALSSDGLLVFNVHGNTWSLRAPAYLVRRFVGRERISQLSHGAVRRMLSRHGLELIEYRGVGLLTRRLAERLGPARRDRAEHLLERIPALQYAATDLIFVAGRSRRAGRAT